MKNQIKTEAVTFKHLHMCVNMSQIAFSSQQHFSNIS